MGDRGDQTDEDGGELGTPAIRAGRIAAGLARLAELARDPRAVNALPTFAEVLDTMRAHADELAAALAESEEADGDASEEIPEAGDAEPIGALPPPGQAAPLTFEALNLAVYLLTRDAKTRLWPVHEAAEVPGAMAEAVATVQKATRALHEFLVALKPAKALHDARGEQAPSAVATGAAASAAAAFLRRFQDCAKLAAPFDAVADMLIDVQVGGHKPRFSRAASAKDVRHPTFWRAADMGQAAVALDARWRAVTLEAQARTARAPKIGNVARLVAEAIAPVFPDHKPGKHRLAGRIVGWRRQAMDGVRGAPKGFKDRHPALELWKSYLAKVANNPDVGGRRSAAEWIRYAEEIETQIRAEVGLKGRAPDEDLPPIASASLRRAP